MTNLKIVLTACISSILLLACEKDCLPDQHQFSFTDHAELNLTAVDSTFNFDYHVNVIEGENLVFKYQFDIAQCESTFDDEYSELLQFEIDSNAENFFFKDSTLTDAKLIFTRSGAWIFDNALVQAGTISGEKKGDNKWKIEIDIQLPLDSNEGSFAGALEENFRK